MRKKWAMRAAWPVAALLLIGAGYWLVVSRHVESTDNAYVRSDVTPISPKVGGYVDELLARDNLRVAAGDVLLRIEADEYRLAVNEAEAKLAETNAALNNIDARLQRQLAMVAQAAADITAAGAELRRAGRQVTREQSLLADEYGTEQRLDRAEAERTTASAMVNRSEAALSETELEIAVLESERELLEARADQAAAALELARIDLADTEVRAPVDGYVGNRSVRVGELVRPGDYLMAVVPADDVWIEANFKETQLTRMKIGQQVEIAIDTYPDIKFTGRVESLSPASGAEFSLIPPENATGNFTKLVQRIPVRILIDPSDLNGRQLRTGMSVYVKVDTRSEGSGPVDSAAAQTLNP